MRMQSLLKMFIALLVLLSTQVFAAQEFLSPEKAFRVEATWLDKSNQIEIEFIPAKGYYLSLIHI
jgi:thiol:disulfide interchange protein DsbD